LFGGGYSDPNTPGMFARGAAFNHGRVTAFAHGGVVSKPTLFPMANGMGLMGEEDPGEAIMPLKRTASGKLGVVAEGGGMTISVPVTINGDASKGMAAKLSRAIEETVRKTVKDLM
jgi:lambda family phage tail tape measure protein